MPAEEEAHVVKCACCGDEVDDVEIVTCPHCKRLVCAGCVLVTRTSMCEDCAEEEDEDERDEHEEEDRRDEFACEDDEFEADEDEVAGDDE